NPVRYTLGRGHVRFFYARLRYLVKRQADLISEMQSRGYRPNFSDVGSLLDGIPPEWCGDWQPTAEAISTNRARIEQRLQSMSAKAVGG
ncbi:MAG: pyrimidine dimer DNA glycosylase/endonuclease V, partial [Bradyrhizobium sp.]